MPEDLPTSLPILVVDDHPPNLLAITVALAPAGVPVVTAASGAEALKLALTQDFVTIVLDVHMPGLDGYQTARLLRAAERSRGVPIIFVSAVYNQPEHTHQGYALGAVDYITKPFDAAVLCAKVRALVSLYTRAQRAERARSEDLERAKNLFLGAVAHDLRNPLHSISMASTLLAADPCSDASHQKLTKTIERAATRMNRIVEDIVDLTRGQFTGGIPVSPTGADLGHISEAVVGELRLAHPERAVALEILGEVTGPWDAGRLARVVSNLVGNAIEQYPQHEEASFRRAAGRCRLGA